jgi:uncharacterized protein YdbL (DUF1318 family)
MTTLRTTLALLLILVATLAGKKLVDRAGSGEYVRDSTGRWVRR